MNIIQEERERILEKQPGFFCYLEEAARRDPALALLAVSHNGLLLEHVLLPARLNEEVIRTALHRSPESWKMTV